MIYTENLIIPLDTCQAISKALSWRHGDNPLYRLGEDDTISYTVVFANKKQADIKCCGVQYEDDSDNAAWTEMVLFDSAGGEICHSDVCFEYLGEWELEDDNNNKYHVNVKMEEY